MTAFKNLTEGSFTATSPLPPYASMLNLSQLKLARLAGSSLNKEFIQQLSIDMRFWKMFLKDGYTLLDKMFGIAGVWNDLQFLSDYMAAHELSDDEKQLVRSLLRPLSPQELNIGGSFTAEQSVMLQTLILITNHDSVPGFGPLVSSWLIQPNATQNSYYQHMTKPSIYLSALSGTEFEAQTHIVDGVRKSKNHDTIKEMTTIWPGTPYNLGGKIFLKKMSGYFSAYIARAHDLNSMIGLVELQLALQSKPAASIPHILSNPNTSGIQFSQELRGKDLKFDPQEGWLEFECLYQWSVCKLQLFSESSD